MRKRISVGIALMTIFLLVCGRPLQGDTLGGPTKVKVSLVPSVAGVVPGRPFDVAIHFEFEPGAHIYWQNSGDAGMAPTMYWKLPQGFAASDLRFPVPRREIKPGDISINILKGDPSLLAEVTPPAAITSASVSIAGSMSFLVCDTNCFHDEAEVSVDLPVLPAGSEAGPANEELFSRARRALPKPSNNLVSVKPSIIPDTLTPGSPFELAIKVEIAKGHHIQSDRPTLPSLIAANVFIERISGIAFDRAVYPAPTTRKDKYLGDLTEFAGSITVRVPGKVEASRELGGVQIAGVFAFQACTDGGNCYPPDAVSFSVPVKVAASTKGAAGGTIAPPPQAAESGAIDAKTSGPGEKSEGIDAILRRFGLIGLLFGCFLYGLSINATPCVLPILSIKVLGFVQQAHESRRQTLMLGLSFGGGVILFFIILGLLASTGRNILQFPTAVIVLGAVVMAFALSMLGVFTLHIPTTATDLEARIHREGIAASFAKGALAPVLGFACTGPLLAGAFGWATQQPPDIAILAFAFAGLGMASPYMLLGANPNWLSFLPRPGNWMVTFERIMGFLLLGMVVWLIHPLTVQIGSTGLEWTLIFYVAVAMACWLLGKVQITMSTAQRWRYRSAAGALVAGCAVLVYGWIYPLDDAVADVMAARAAAGSNGANVESNDHVAWRPWSQQAVEETVRAGKLAFVDFTAAYCTICKVNKKIAINTPEVVEKLKMLNAVAFQADFTEFDPKIAEALVKFKGSILLPLNLIYPPGKPDAPIVLETNLTKAYLLRELDEAGPGHAVTASMLGPQS